jgi:hypothetical protein
MEGRLMSNGQANSVTDASPTVNRARIARRVGSASAENVVLRGSGIQAQPPKYGSRLENAAYCHIKLPAVRSLTLGVFRYGCNLLAVRSEHFCRRMVLNTVMR